MDELLDYFELLLKYTEENGSNLNRSSQDALAQLIQQFSEIIQEIGQNEPIQGAEQNPAETPRQLPTNPSNDAQLLWILAGQQPEAFISYLRTFPTTQTQSLLNDPNQLNATIVQLNQMMPKGELPVIGGIQHADLNSSNVWGAAYDPKTGKMRVRFQEGGIYEYDGVPKAIFDAFIHGNAEAKTSGRNQYGRWWRGKNPSLGAALNQYIKLGKFPYRKIR